MLKKIIICLGTVLVMSSIIVGSSFDKDYQKMTSLEKGDALPRYELMDLSGKSSELSHKGRPLVVSVFTTWCSVCKVELRDLQEEYDDIIAHGVPIDVVIINAGEDNRKVSKYMSRRQLTLPILLDRSLAFTKGLNIMGTPTILIFDENNTLIYQGTELPKEWKHHLEKQ